MFMLTFHKMHTFTFLKKNITYGSRKIRFNINHWFAFTVVGSKFKTEAFFA